MFIRARVLVPLILAVLAAGCGSNRSQGGSHTAYVILPGTNQLIGYSVSNGSGNLTTITGSPFATGPSPSSMFLHPSSKFLYVANAGEADISLFTIANSGRVTEVMPRTAVRTNPLSLTGNPAGSLLFAGNETTNNISVFSIDAGSGALKEVSGSPFATDSPVALAVSPSGNFLYAANSNSATVSAFSIGSGGTLTAIGSPFLTGIGPRSMVIDPTGHVLYVANPLAGNFSAYIIGSSGSLSQVAGSPFTAGTTPSAVALDSTGKILYVANFGSANVSGYAIDSTTGIPTQISSTTSGGTATVSSPFTVGTGPIFISPDPNGKFVFVCNQTTNSISIMKVNSSAGDLTLASSLTIGTSPTAMVILK